MNSGLFPSLQARTLITNSNSGKMFSPAHEMQDLKEKERVNGLHNAIKNEIRQANGAPMSLARFMELGLMHQEFGYYSTKDTIFNKGGDFTTSPEISQMFGEMMGVWLVTAFKNYTKLLEYSAP